MGYASLSPGSGEAQEGVLLEQHEGETEGEVARQSPRAGMQRPAGQAAQDIQGQEKTVW